jgi:hypothetical protein
MAEVLQKLFRTSLMERADRTYAEYKPRQCDVVTRASCWNANLFLLMALDRKEISMRELYPEKANSAAGEWHRLTNMWRGCIRGSSLADCLDVDRTWDGEDPDVVVRIGRRLYGVLHDPDMKWSYHTPGSSWQDGRRWDSHSLFELSVRANFFVDRRTDVVMHNMMPLADMLPTLGNTVYNTRDGQLVTAIHLLTAALVAPHRLDAGKDLVELALSLKRLPTSTIAEDETDLYWQLALRLLTTAIESGTLSDSVRGQLWAALNRVTAPSYPLATKVWELIKALNDQIASDTPTTAPAPPEREASPPPEPSPTTSSPGTPATPPAAP